MPEGIPSWDPLGSRATSIVQNRVCALQFLMRNKVCLRRPINWQRVAMALAEKARGELTLATLPLVEKNQIIGKVLDLIRNSVEELMVERFPHRWDNFWGPTAANAGLRMLTRKDLKTVSADNNAADTAIRIIESFSEFRKTERIDFVRVMLLGRQRAGAVVQYARLLEESCRPDDAAPQECDFLLLS